MPDEELDGTGRAAPEALETGAAGEEAKTAPVGGRLEARSRVSIPETAALFVVLVILFVFFSMTAEFFFNSNNIINILQNVARAGIIAAPATILLIAGQFDLSVGSTAAFVAMAMAVFASDPETAKTPFALGLSVEMAFVAAMLVALVVGLINGISVTVFRINALITTLGTLAIFRGLTKVLGDGQTIRVEGFGGLGITRVLEIPIPVYIFAAVVVISFLVLRYSTYGRAMYATGASPTAARLAGIRTKRNVLIAFIASALAAGLSGLILLSQVGGASVNANIGLELTVVTAVVLGGASLAGGRGGIVGTILAVLVLGVLANGLIQLRIPSFWIEVFGGVLLLVAVGFDQVRIRLTKAESWGGRYANMTELAWSESIGKRVRVGDWADQSIPTLAKARDAMAEAGDEFGLKAGRREVAAQLVDYFMEEAKVVYVIYEVWTQGFVDWLSSRGVATDELESELVRLRALMAYPDGTPLDAKARWDALGERAGRLAKQVRAYQISVADGAVEMDGLSEDWRRLHDRYADVMAGVLAFAARRFGEASLEDCYRAVLEPYIQERYMPFDVRVNPYTTTTERNIYTVFEAMRAHLVGPARDGSMDVEETDDYIKVSFDPCGSGGRSMRGDEIEGTGSRVLQPYEFGVTEEKYDWAWNEEGVCYYCAHCCLTLEKLPEERWGHPVRVVDPPIWGGSADAESTQRKCSWTVYKSLEAIPESAYERIGHKKPQLPVLDVPPRPR